MVYCSMVHGLGCHIPSEHQVGFFFFTDEQCVQYVFHHLENESDGEEGNNRRESQTPRQREKECTGFNTIKFNFLISAFDSLYLSCLSR